MVFGVEEWVWCWRWVSDNECHRLHLAFYRFPGRCGKPRQRNVILFANSCWGKTMLLKHSFHIKDSSKDKWRYCSSEISFIVIIQNRIFYWIISRNLQRSFFPSVYIYILEIKFLSVVTLRCFLLSVAFPFWFCLGFP